MPHTEPPSRRSILIVEDEPMIAMMLEEFVETLGHHVAGVAQTVAEALEKVRMGGFDLAILDCHLAGEGVWPVAAQLERAAIPFVLSSGGTTADIPPEYAGRPSLEKPYSIGMIADTLELCAAAKR